MIYDQFDREISYRIDRKVIREVIAAYLYDQKAERLMSEEHESNYNDLASAIIRKMTSRHVGWLEEETDDATLDKTISFSENGLALAEYLISVQAPEKEEYSAFIIQIYNTLRNPDLWREHPYINGLKYINAQARALSKSLKKLSTYIRKIIERMIVEESFESLTENLLEYFDGSFVREYSRLTKQQNVYRYRGVIRTELERIRQDEMIMERILEDCRKEELLDESEAKEFLLEMIAGTRRFLFDDYEKIMKDIKHKINVYLQVGIGRARFLRNREIDEKSSVEQTIKYIATELSELSVDALLPEELSGLFSFERNEFIDTTSIRYPGKTKMITNATTEEIEELSEDALKEAKRQMEKEAFNPYSKERMKVFFDDALKGRLQVEASNLPLIEKEDLLSVLSAVAYAKENGFALEIRDSYLETNGMLIKDFVLRKQ